MGGGSDSGSDNCGCKSKRVITQSVVSKIAARPTLHNRLVPLTSILLFIGGTFLYSVVHQAGSERLLISRDFHFDNSSPFYAAAVRLVGCCKGADRSTLATDRRRSRGKKKLVLEHSTTILFQRHPTSFLLCPLASYVRQQLAP